MKCRYIPLPMNMDGVSFPPFPRERSKMKRPLVPTELQTRISVQVLFFQAHTSGDGKVIAIGEPQSMNGKVSIFRNDARTWKLEAQLNGTVSNEKFGSSLALSGNGNQIVVLNDGGGETRATVYTTLRESTWIPAIEDLTLALKNAKVFLSQDGGRVAIGGDGSVVVYDIVE